MNYRQAGFTQRKPQRPGVYFVSARELRPNRVAPPRNAEGWDVAEVIFWAGSYTNVHENTESSAHWRIKCLDGLEYPWRRGMWIKGPISPLASKGNDVFADDQETAR